MKCYPNPQPRDKNSGKYIKSKDEKHGSDQSQVRCGDATVKHKELVKLMIDSLLANLST